MPVGPTVCTCAAIALLALPLHRTDQLGRRLLAALLPGGRQPVFFLLIPKTASSSLKRDLPPVLHVKVVERETCYDEAEQFAVGRVVTMLRRPRDHVLSQYNFCKWSPHILHHGGGMNISFQAWLQYWEEVVRSGSVEADYLPGEDWGPLWATSLPFKCYSPVNLQSHHLSCQTPMRYSKAIDTEAAIRNMRAIWSVGLVEAYKESICLAHARAHGWLPGYCNCENKIAWSSFKVTNLTWGVPRYKGIEAYPEEVQQAVDRLTAGDRVLYAAAVERFSQEVRQVERRYGRRILCGELAA